MRVSEGWLAEIVRSAYHITRRSILVILLLFCILPVSFSQASAARKTVKRKVELLHADYGNILKEKGTGEDIHHFVGNVRLRHNDALMYCDSAYFSPSRNQLTAFSKVHINQGDTLNLYGDYLFYDGKIENAEIRKHVELIDKQTHLYTEAINYDVRNRIATYNTGGRITNDKNTLTSKHGVYYASRSLFHFKDSVKIVNPHYLMRSDSMDYNTKTEISYFNGPSTLKGDSLFLTCEKGWYDSKNKITSVWHKAFIDNKKQMIHGDSLFFDDSTGYGEAYRNVIIEDTTNSIAIEGNYSWYYKRPEKFMITGKATFIEISGKDSLFLHADTIRAKTNTDTTGKGYRLVRAYYGCRLFSKDFQGRCDSLSYSFQDSVIRFYRKPVLWSEDDQLTSADSMAIFTKNRKAEKLEVYDAAFVTSQVDTARYNQIKGRSLTGTFLDNKLHTVDVKGNGESIYFLVDGKTISGINHSKCANIQADVVDGKISIITDIGNPEGYIDPPDKAKPSTLKLEGFSWLDKERPKSRADIYIK